MNHSLSDTIHRHVRSVHEFACCCVVWAASNMACNSGIHSFPPPTIVTYQYSSQPRDWIHSIGGRWNHMRLSVWGSGFLLVTRRRWHCSRHPNPSLTSSEQRQQLADTTRPPQTKDFSYNTTANQRMTQWLHQTRQKTPWTKQETSRTTPTGRFSQGRMRLTAQIFPVHTT